MSPNQSPWPQNIVRRLRYERGPGRLTQVYDLQAARIVLELVSTLHQARAGLVGAALLKALLDPRPHRIAQARRLAGLYRAEMLGFERFARWSGLLGLATRRQTGDLLLAEIEALAVGLGHDSQDQEEPLTSFEVAAQYERLLTWLLTQLFNPADAVSSDPDPDPPAAEAADTDPNYDPRVPLADVIERVNRQLMENLGWLAAETDKEDRP